MAEAGPCGQPLALAKLSAGCHQRGKTCWAQASHCITLDFHFTSWFQARHTPSLHGAGSPRRGAVSSTQLSTPLPTAPLASSQPRPRGRGANEMMPVMCLGQCLVYKCCSVGSGYQSYCHHSYSRLLPAQVAKTNGEGQDHKLCSNPSSVSAGCVTLDKSLHLSEPQHPHLYSENKSPHLQGLLERLDEETCM